MTRHVLSPWGPPEGGRRSIDRRPPRTQHSTTPSAPRLQSVPRRSRQPVAPLALLLGCLATGCCLFPVEEPAAPPALSRESDSARPIDFEVLRARLERGRDTIASLPGYTATLHVHERVNGRLREPKSFQLELHHDPFTVTLETLTPPSDAGRVVRFRDGWNDNQLHVTTPGVIGSLTGPLSIDPHGTLAKSGNRYPITDTGILRLTEKVIEQLEDIARTPGVEGLEQVTTWDGEPLRLYELEVPPSSTDGPEPIPARRIRLGLHVEDDYPLAYATWTHSPTELLLLEQYRFTDLSAETSRDDEGP